MPAVFSKKSLPLILIVIFGVVLFTFYKTKPKASRDFTAPEAQVLVDVLEIKTEPFQPTLESYGRVEPLIQSQLVAQVGGRITEVAEAFRDGGFFTRNETLLSIDPVDYEIEVSIAKSALADARQNLQEQIALAEQARLDWKRAGANTKALPLTLREPQLAAAKAKVASAEAGVRKAELNLQRTQISAPFDGRVLSTNVDIGQVVNPGSVLGEIYASNAIEVRLPLKNSDLQFINLPETYQSGEAQTETLPDVTLVSELVGTEHWNGKIVRTSSAIDEASRQLYVVARVDNPFGDVARGRFPLKIGQYVTAHIAGATINEALIIPLSTIYQGSYVYVYREGAVYRQPVEVAWQDNSRALIESGLQAGAKLVLSPLGQVNSGTKVKLNAAGKSNASQREQRR